MQHIISDESWRAATGPILSSSLYDGETYYARLGRAGWSEAGFDDCDWSPVKVKDIGRDHLVASARPPVRRIQEVSPVESA